MVGLTRGEIVTTALLPVMKWKPKRKLLITTGSKVSFEDAVLIGDRCFGSLGRQTVALWKRYNHDYFNGLLESTPVLYVPTSPWGAWVGCFTRDRNIYLMCPGEKRSWGYVRGVLLHEMLHQFLEQSGKDVGHDGEPWRQEIMRLSQIFGKHIWAGNIPFVRSAENRNASTCRTRTKTRRHKNSPRGRSLAGRIASESSPRTTRSYK